MIGAIEAGESARQIAESTGPLRVNPALLDADVVVIVTAAETVLHGGPGSLLGACGREVIRATTSYSLNP